MEIKPTLIAQQIINAFSQHRIPVDTDSSDHEPTTVQTPTGEVASFTMFNHHPTAPNLRVEYTVTVVGQLIDLDQE
jgi:hypothetical protein